MLANQMTNMPTSFNLVERSWTATSWVTLATTPLQSNSSVQLSPTESVIMADNARKIEEPDAEELGGLVTKPFKFVTGMLQIELYVLRESVADESIAGYDARFPNQNQYANVPDIVEDASD
jgi:hypothetical protein